MNITINLVEVASKLAHNALLDEVNNPMYDDFIWDEEELYNFDENGNTSYKPIFQKIFDRWYDYFFSVIENLRNKTYYPIVFTYKDDLKELGFNTDNIDEDTMQILASKLGNDYCEQLYWTALPIIAEHLKIPKK